MEKETQDVGVVKKPSWIQAAIVIGGLLLIGFVIGYLARGGL